MAQITFLSSFSTMVKVAHKAKVKVALSEFAVGQQNFLKKLREAFGYVAGMHVLLEEHFGRDLPGNKKVTLKPGCIVREGTSKVSIHCRPKYHGHPRYDFAMAEVEGEDTLVALRCLLEIKVANRHHHLAAVQSLAHVMEHEILQVPQHHGEYGLRIVPIQALKTLVPVVRDNSQEHKYYVNTYFQEFEKREYDQHQ